MIKDIKEELGTNNSLLILTSGIDYNDIIIEVAKQLFDKKICYVTLNKTYEALVELFEKHKIILPRAGADNGKEDENQPPGPASNA